MCVDYTSLNKHCPKDPFPLPHVDQIIDARPRCARLSFLDAYSGYNQIKLKKEGEEKTAFITPYGVFCYQVMPFVGEMTPGRVKRLQRYEESG
jgi:putative transposase